MQKNPVGVRNRADFAYRPFVSFVWQDKQHVRLLSTVHSPSTTSVSRVLRKDGQWSKVDVPCPDVVHDYTMGEVDLSQLCQYYLKSQKCPKWYHQVNSYQLYLANQRRQHIPTAKDLSFAAVYLEVCGGPDASAHEDWWKSSAIQVSNPGEETVPQVHASFISWCHVLGPLNVAPSLMWP